MLYLYTGQRGSDVVRIGFTDIDEGGFSVHQRKTGRDVWCPIVPELAAEIATWEKRPGPFLRQANGKPYSRKLFWKHFDEARADIPELADVTLHGLRCTAVIRLRRAGLSIGQIGDIAGMSLATIERYCRFADRKTSGQAALVQLTGRTVKQTQNYSMKSTVVAPADESITFIAYRPQCAAAPLACAGWVFQGSPSITVALKSPLANHELKQLFAP